MGPTEISLHPSLLKSILPYSKKKMTASTLLGLNYLKSNLNIFLLKLKSAVSDFSQRKHPIHWHHV